MIVPRTQPEPQAGARIDNLTNNGHDVVMKAVKIAALKSQLSQHLRAVRAGQTVTVFDRTTPVARLVPIDSLDDIAVTVPVAGSLPVGRIPLPAPSRTTIDVVKLLLEDRRRRR
jgi:prevent-host-death family protein